MTRIPPGVRTSLLLAFLSSSLLAQVPFTSGERIQGYAARGDTLVFVFDPIVYGVTPRTVVVTGGMRQWSTDMEESRWRLQPRGTVWTLALPPGGGGNFGPGTPFKFRVDEGRWLDPPHQAPNRESGNLVLFADHPRIRWKAEIVGPRDIRLLGEPDTVPIDRDPSAYSLRDGEGRPLAVNRVLWVRRGEVRLVPADSLDPRGGGTLLRRGQPPLPLSLDGWFRTFVSEKPLGAQVSLDRSSTTLRVFSPRASRIRAYLYPERTGPASDTLTLVRDDQGLWDITLPRDLTGFWYDFTVHGPNLPGTEFFEQVPVHVTDPYARVSDDTYGRCRIRPPTTPARPLAGGIPRMEDVLAYEVHVEDFTLALPGLPDSLRGTFTGFATPGLRNQKGEPVGLDHLSDLGINVVHLLPVQEFLQYPDEEWQAAFRDDPDMIARGIHLSNYDWGYRTSHALALESRYRVKGSEQGAQNEQFRDLVQALHERGIAVVVDVVFNHTAERMDARVFHHHFSVFDRAYYYRSDDSLRPVGDYGTETKSEDRPMVSRWIIDQCRALIDEYGVDGFRIDLAGLTDTQTLLDLKRAIGADKIVYGEPWIASADPAYEANPDYNWYKTDAPITYFQDDTRNALCGPPDSPQDKKRDRGYAGGNGNRDAAKRAIANRFPEERTPNDGINYLDIHDNWALADRFAVRDWNGELGVEEDRYRIASALLLTSLGPVVLHGGSEFMRSKGAAGTASLTKRTATGPIWIHGARDTYNLRTPNLFQWENLGLTQADGAPCDYRAMNNWWKGLIALRQSAAGSCLRVGQAVPEDYVRWWEPRDSLLLGYSIDRRLLVLVNTGDENGRFQNFSAPEGDWILVADGDRAGTSIIAGHPWSRLRGGRSQDMVLPPRSVRIWIRP